MRNIFFILYLILPEILSAQDTIVDAIKERDLNYFPKTFSISDYRDTLIVKGKDTLIKILFLKNRPFTGVQKIDAGNGTIYYYSYKKGQKIYSEYYQNNTLVLYTPYKNGKIHGTRVGRNEQGEIVVIDLLDHGCIVKSTQFKNSKKYIEHGIKNAIIPTNLDKHMASLEKLKIIRQIRDINGEEKRKSEVQKATANSKQPAR